MEEIEILQNEAGNPLTQGPITNDKIFDMLFNEEDITWQALIYELVKTNQMNPWDIDVSILAKSFIDMIKKLKDMDFRISGKIVLASAILLKMKSNQFMLEDITAFDKLIYASGEDEEEFLDDGDGYLDMAENEFSKNQEMPKLYPRTPQPRKRKVSIFDLVKALEKALEVKNRRRFDKNTAPKVFAPKNYRDISLVIKDVYDQVKKFFNTNSKITFTQLLPSDDREDKVYTFIPLLHLRNQHKIDLHQDFHFGEIEIELKTDAEVEAAEVR